MPNFSIGWYENHLAAEGLLLQFVGTKEETILSKMCGSYIKIIHPR